MVRSTSLRRYFRRLKLNRWRDALQADLLGLPNERTGTAAVHQRLSKAFGSEPVNKALLGMGEKTSQLADRGHLRVTRGGPLTTGAGVSAQPKRFYGGRAAR